MYVHLQTQCVENCQQGLQLRVALTALYSDQGVDTDIRQICQCLLVYPQRLASGLYNASYFFRIHSLL